MPILGVDRDRYLTLTGFAGIGRHLLSHRAVVVVDRGAGDLLWFNPAAARALGIAGLDDPQPRREALAAALLSAVRRRVAGGYYPRGGLERLRLEVDLASRAITCRLEPVRLPGGEPALLVDVMEPLGDGVGDPAAAACRLVAGDGFAAVVDRGGAVRASAGAGEAAGAFGGVAGALRAASQGVPGGPLALALADAATLLVVPAPEPSRRSGGPDGDRFAETRWGEDPRGTSDRSTPRRDVWPITPERRQPEPAPPPRTPDFDLVPVDAPIAAAPPPVPVPVPLPPAPVVAAPVQPPPAAAAPPPPVVVAPPAAVAPPPEPPGPAFPPMAPPPSGRRRTRRFSWQMDAADRFTFVSPELVEEVGVRAGDVVGQTWRQVADRLGFDGERRIDKALASRAAWSGHWVVWPADDGWAVPIDFAAIATTDEGGRFGGYRGFGLVRAAEAKGPPAAATEPADEPGTADAPSPVEVPVPAPPVAAVAAPSGSPPPTAAAANPAPIAAPPPAEMALTPPQPVPSPEPVSAQATQPPAHEARPAPPPSQAPSPSAVSGLQTVPDDGLDPAPHSSDRGSADRLSRPEQEALHLIATALGARIEGEEPTAAARRAAAAADPTDEDDAEDEAWPGRLPAIPTAPRRDAGGGDAPSRDLEGAATSSVAPVRPTRAVAAVAPAEDTDIVDRMPVGVLICRDGDVIHANPAALALLGHADAAALSAAGGLSAVFATPAPDAPVERRVAVERADGTRLPVTARLHRVPWRGGRALMVVLSPEPAEPAARAAERAPAEPSPGPSLLDPPRGAVVAALAEAVLLVDRRGVVTTANPAAAALLGRPVDEIEGALVTHLVALDSRLAMGAVLADLYADGAEPPAPLERDLMVLHPERGQVPVAAGFGRLAGSPPPGLCIVLRDLTRFREAEAALTLATREAERASAHKSEVLARVSHEIRTPLNAIIGFAEVMLEEKFGPLGNERYREYLRDVRASGAHIMSLVNDLLDLAKIEAGRADLAPEAVSLNEVVQSSIALIQPRASAERVFVRSTLAAGLPDVLADRRSLRQILLNLLSNAVKFNSAGGQVIVSTRRDEGGGVSLRVRDTGIGMSGEEISLALQPFRQVNGSHEGTGLGLPLTKALVEANAATFQIQSAPGRGTLVEVLFPAARVLAA